MIAIAAHHNAKAHCSRPDLALSRRWSTLPVADHSTRCSAYNLYFRSPIPAPAFAISLEPCGPGSTRPYIDIRRPTTGGPFRSRIIAYSHPRHRRAWLGAFAGLSTSASSAVQTIRDRVVHRTAT